MVRGLDGERVDGGGRLRRDLDWRLQGDKHRSASEASKQLVNW